MKISVVRLVVLPLLILVYQAEGGYRLLVRSYSYSNPSNRCGGCSTNERCCDSNAFSCRYNWQRCDNVFNYCLRTINQPTSTNQPISSAGCIVHEDSSINRDGRAIDFSGNTVLGLPNPLPLDGISPGWNGVQLLIEVIDDDTQSSDDFVDRFIFNFNSTYLPVGVESTPMTYDGEFGLAQMELSFRVECAEYFYGPDCSQFCEWDCECASGFTGEFCHINIDECVSVTCPQNSQCVDGINTYECVCDPGFTGDQCETNINDCMEDSCNGNGQCMDRVNSFRCNCSLGFTGEFCQTNIDDCVQDSCNGNGQCEDGVNSFNCTCDPGFTGDQCEENIDDCVEHNCSGNGQCRDGVETFTCNCSLGFTGRMCEENIDDCVGVNCSGNGQCRDGIDSYTCECDAGFTGNICNQTAQAEAIGGGTQIGGIIGGVLGALFVLVLLVLLAVIAMAVLNRRRQKSIELDKAGSALPGDNPVYETTADPSNVIPLSVPRPTPVAVATTTNTIASPPDHEFDNPLYEGATSDIANDTYESVPERELDNPLYGSPGGANSNPSGNHGDTINHYEFAADDMQDTTPTVYETPTPLYDIPGGNHGNAVRYSELREDTGNGQLYESVDS